MPARLLYYHVYCGLVLEIGTLGYALTSLTGGPGDVAHAGSNITEHTKMKETPTFI